MLWPVSERTRIGITPAAAAVSWAVFGAGLYLARAGGDGCGSGGGGKGHQHHAAAPPRPRDRLPPGRPTMLDLLIAGGLVVDGSGNPGYHGAVGIEGERVRDLPRRARRTSPPTARVDATGRVACPGFIDMHAHSGLVILAEPRHEPKVRRA